MVTTDFRRPCRGEKSCLMGIANRWLRFACHRLISVAPSGQRTAAEQRGLFTTASFQSIQHSQFPSVDRGMLN